MNTKYAKKYTIELTENELARVLFIMRAANGRSDYGISLTSFALEKLGVKEIASFEVLQSKWEELAKIANLPRFINYYSIQKEWETFLGIYIPNDKLDTLNKIDKLEREIAELKETL